MKHCCSGPVTRHEPQEGRERERWGVKTSEKPRQTDPLILGNSQFAKGRAFKRHGNDAKVRPNQYIPLRGYIGSIIRAGENRSQPDLVQRAYTAYTFSTPRSLTNVPRSVGNPQHIARLVQLLPALFESKSSARFLVAPPCLISPLSSQNQLV